MKQRFKAALLPLAILLVLFPVTVRAGTGAAGVVAERGFHPRLWISGSGPVASAARHGQYEVIVLSERGDVLVASNDAAIPVASLALGGGSIQSADLNGDDEADFVALFPGKHKIAVGISRPGSWDVHWIDRLPDSCTDVLLGHFLLRDRSSIAVIDRSSGAISISGILTSAAGAVSFDRHDYVSSPQLVSIFPLDQDGDGFDEIIGQTKRNDRDVPMGYQVIGFAGEGFEVGTTRRTDLRFDVGRRSYWTFGNFLDYRICPATFAGGRHGLLTYHGPGFLWTAWTLDSENHADYLKGQVVQLLSREWALLSPASPVTFSACGDFDGNGITDGMAWSVRDKNLWIALSNDEAGVEMRVPAAFDAHRDWLLFVISDVDRSGTDDVVAFEEKSGDLWAAISSGLALPRRPERSGPQPCVGYLPSGSTKWGQVLRCPAGYLFFGADDASISNFGLSASCCPLPYPDMLGTEHLEALNVCPPEFVATGVFGNSERLATIRCTKINTKRYVLGPDLPGVYYGLGFSGFQSSKKVMRSDLPPALRSGLGRRERDSWDTDGCVGYPWGTVLAGSTGSACSRQIYRQFFFRSPEQGGLSAVPMIPVCSSLSSDYSAYPECLGKQQPSASGLAH